MAAILPDRKTAKGHGRANHPSHQAKNGRADRGEAPLRVAEGEKTLSPKVGATARASRAEYHLDRLLPEIGQHLGPGVSAQSAQRTVRRRRRRAGYQPAAPA